jgi:hypothetical protein
VNTVTDARLRRAGSLEKNPRLSQWLRLERDGTVSVFSGKVEIGQGILTALAQIAGRSGNRRSAFVWFQPTPPSAPMKE